jgi:mono/diheme cytochrome c family protein
MKRRSLFLLAGIAVALIVTLMVGASMIRRGFSAHDEPSAVEAMMARSMRRWAVPADLRDLENPVPPTSQVLSEGLSHFADHCATCHGNDGKGADLGRRMYPKTPDMTLPATQLLSDGELFSIIENGVRMTGMPGFGAGTAESAYGSWGLVHFIRHLPNLTPQEIAQMEKLNPKTPAAWQQMQEEEAFLSGAAGREATQPADERAATPHHH